jgi:hypothetical protein
MEAKQYGTNILVTPWEDKLKNTHMSTTKHF